MEFTAPSAPVEAQKYIPEEKGSFSQDLWYVIRNALSELEPSFVQTFKLCASLVCVAVLISVLNGFSSTSKALVDFIGAVSASLVLLEPTVAIIHTGTDTIREISNYGMLLLPVMAAALAAQGGSATSTALYTGTAAFNSVLSTGISKILIPMVYIYLALCIIDCVSDETLIKSFKKFVKWIMTWSMKLVLYAFTGYLSVTGVISGAADAAAIKATKIAISGAVPVVGSIISDASETILISAGIMKSSAGIYGIIVMIAILVVPFIKTGAQYLMIKVSGAIANTFGCKSTGQLVEDFASAMGFVMAMIGTVCLMLLVSTVCFIRGVD